MKKSLSSSGICWLAASLLLSATAQAAPPAPPASAAASGAQKIALVNPSFVLDTKGEMAGWNRVEHASGNSYTFTADPKRPKSRPSSLRIHRHGKEAFGLFEQRVVVLSEWRGHTVRLSGFLKTADASGGGGALVLQARTNSAAILAHDHMDELRLKGDRDWTRVSVQVKLPPTTQQLLVGVMLEEGGTLWADDLVLELID